MSSKSTPSSHRASPAFASHSQSRRHSRVEVLAHGGPRKRSATPRLLPGQTLVTTTRPKPAARFEYWPVVTYRNADGRRKAKRVKSWSWHLKAANNEIVAGGSGFNTVSSVTRSCMRVRVLAAEAELILPVAGNECGMQDNSVESVTKT